MHKEDIFTKIAVHDVSASSLEFMCKQPERSTGTPLLRLHWWRLLVEFWCLFLVVYTQIPYFLKCAHSSYNIFQFTRLYCFNWSCCDHFFCPQMNLPFVLQLLLLLYLIAITKTRDVHFRQKMQSVIAHKL